ncbi:MAG: DJ-1/PfpI family protein [Gammaproteobacteria bacterium]|nr:DJ-1/PfpI family protein [Gammaproteobacteria bacterium]
MKTIIYFLFFTALVNLSYALNTSNNAERTAPSMNSSPQPSEKVLKLGVILFPDFDQLDVTAPLEIFHNFPNTKIYFISNNLKTVPSSVAAIKIKPNTTFATAPQLDVLFVPGGFGVVKAISNDKAMMHFIQQQTPKLQYLSSVCTGALILGSAGELKGYQATTHWMAQKYLPAFGAIPVKQRVVVDRNRVTGAGVSSGMDVALQLGDLLFGKVFVEKQELLAEYFNHSVLYNTTPETASPEAKKELAEQMQPLIKAREDFFSRQEN